MPDPVTLTAVALWIADKATGGVVGDYGKKLVKKVLKQKDQEDKSAEELRLARQNYETVIKWVQDLLTENEGLQKDVIQLRVENNLLKAKLANLEQNGIPVPSPKGDGDRPAA